MEVEQSWAEDQHSSPLPQQPQQERQEEVAASTCMSKDPPLVHVQFYDNNHAQGIYQLIEAYMLSLQEDPLSQDLRQQVSAVSRDLQAKETPSTEEDTDKMEITVPSTEPEFEGRVEYYPEFCLDRYPMTYKTQVLFDQVYSNPFWIDPFVLREEKRLRRMAIKCFNCGEDHHINHCTEPRDNSRILKEFRLFKESLGIIGSDKRYFLNTNNNDRFSKFHPGQISARLRQALGIGPFSIPLYIPRMHFLDYPPGHLLQAQAQEQTLHLYDSTETGDSGNTQEDPESFKVIVYPGYNDHDSSNQVATPCAALSKEGEGVVSGHAAAEEGRGVEALRRRRRRTMTKEGGRERGKVRKQGKGPGKTMLEDDLGTLSDYELEELDGDDGEMVVGFCVKKAPKPTEESSSGSKGFSLDFPPGLVDLEASIPASSQKWNSIQDLLKSGKNV